VYRLWRDQTHVGYRILTKSNNPQSLSYGERLKIWDSRHFGFYDRWDFNHCAASWTNIASAYQISAKSISPRPSHWRFRQFSCPFFSGGKLSEVVLRDLWTELRQICEPNYVRFVNRTTSDLWTELRQIYEPNYVRFVNRTTSDLWTELRQIWGERRTFIGAPKLLLVFLPVS